MRLSIAVALAGISALHAWPAQAATVFDNYNGADNAGFFGPPPLFASGFTPTANYDFTGAAAFVENLDKNNATQLGGATQALRRAWGRSRILFALAAVC